MLVFRTSHTCLGPRHRSRLCSGLQPFFHVYAFDVQPFDEDRASEFAVKKQNSAGSTDSASSEA